jgi:hypothetical protein
VGFAALPSWNCQYTPVMMAVYDLENLLDLGQSAMEMDERAGTFSFDFSGS